jgi:hypothetical protein
VLRFIEFIELIGFVRSISAAVLPCCGLLREFGIDN